ncbi:hypothetical protein [Streptomyces sp. 351MFTsu5.1]|uniref:hypothetical protein n=1 Tax=Streptomyces sp. 351MFTsu5.1 TaxID=1172180 RepID=UPI00131A099F|nr:hypothetical protein [Streptomyces sp. 351MFTsu5.1]
MPEIRRIHEGREFPRSSVDAGSPEAVVPSSELTFATRRLLRAEANRDAVIAARTAGQRALLDQSLHLFNALVDTALELSGGEPFRAQVMGQACVSFFEQATQRAAAAATPVMNSKREWLN